MPTPRMHGGAALTLIPMNVPAFMGLNTQQETSLLGPQWATKLRNAVLDDSGRVAARKGWNKITTTPLTEDIVQIGEYYLHTGAKSLIVSTDTKLYRSINNGATFSDITGSLSFTDGNWQMLNFGDDMYIVQSGETPARYNVGLGVFTAIADVNVPTGGVGLSAFSRLWIADADGHSLSFSGLLDGTDWTSVDDAGVMDFENVWPETDVITGLAAFNSSLVVFGRNNIIIIQDGSGTMLGIDPFQAYIADVLPGVGCIARDSIQLVDGDLWFLSSSGLQSFGRLLQQRNNPMFNLSSNVENLLSQFVSASSDIRSVYSPEEKFYLLSMPAVFGGGAFVFDTRDKLQDGTARCIGVWDNFVPRAIIRTDGGDIISSVTDLGEPTAGGGMWAFGVWAPNVFAQGLFADFDTEFFDSFGCLGIYTGQLDNGEGYVFDYESAWMDITDATQKGCLTIPKRLAGIFYLSSTTEIQFKWAFDFTPTFRRATKLFQGGGTQAQWGSAQWGLSKFGGGVSLRSKRVPASGLGRYIKVGVTADINNTELSIQSLDLYSKIGRLA